jgi:hypothetical protein
MESQTLETPQKEEAEKQALQLVTDYTTFEITNNDQLEQADEIIKRVNNSIRDNRDAWDPVIKAAKQAHTVALAGRDKIIDPLENLKAFLVKGRVAYLQWVKAEQAKAEEKQREAQRKLDEEAEAQRQAQIKAQEDARVEKAVDLEKQGRGAEAERLLSIPVPPPPPPPMRRAVAPIYAPPPPPKSSGISMADKWEAVIPSDEKEYRDALFTLAKKAVEDPDGYLHYISINEKTVNAIARNSAGKARVPGITFVNNPVTSVRRK